MIKTWGEDTIYIIIYLLAEKSANEPELDVVPVHALCCGLKNLDFGGFDVKVTNKRLFQHDCD